MPIFQKLPAVRTVPVRTDVTPFPSEDTPAGRTKSKLTNKSIIHTYTQKCGRFFKPPVGTGSTGLNSRVATGSVGHFFKPPFGHAKRGQ